MKQPSNLADALTIERDLPVLEALAADPSLSHRGVASRTGLSTAGAHFILRRLMEKGFVKMKSAATSKHKLRYLYVLTPRGIEAKARLTYRFMHRMAEQYQAMVGQVAGTLEKALDEAAVDGNGAVKLVKLWIAGAGPLAEVVRDVAGVQVNVVLVDDQPSADLIVVVDPALCSVDGSSARLVHLA